MIMNINIIMNTHMIASIRKSLNCKMSTNAVINMIMIITINMRISQTIGNSWFWASNELWLLILVVMIMRIVISISVSSDLEVREGAMECGYRVYEDFLENAKPGKTDSDDERKRDRGQIPI